MTVGPLDPVFVKAFMVQPKIWSRVSEGGANPEDYDPHPSEVSHYIGNEQTVTVFHKASRYMWQVHIASISKTPEQDGLDCIQWMQQNTDAVKLLAMIPAYNWHAVAYARRIGFMGEGRISGAYWWRDKLRDAVILGRNIWQAQ